MNSEKLKTYDFEWQKGIDVRSFAKVEFHYLQMRLIRKSIQYQIHLLNEN